MLTIYLLKLAAGYHFKQENCRTVRLCSFLRKTTTLVVHFAHVNPWLFIIPMTKLFLDFCAPSSQMRVKN